MLCRVEMPANEQIYGRFYRYKLMHNIGGGGRTALILMPILAVVALLLTWDGQNVPVVGLAAIAAVAGYFIYTLVMKPNQLFRKQAGAAMNTEVTIFTDTGFTRSVRNEEGGLPDNMSAQYSALSKVVETGKDFFLFTGPSQAFLIDKEYFTKGSPEELRVTMRKKLGKSFESKQK